MKFFAIAITASTLPLVTELNDGVAPGPESMNHIFMYPATKPDENHSTIITKEELATTHAIEENIVISIVHVN